MSVDLVPAGPIADAPAMSQRGPDHTPLDRWTGLRAIGGGALAGALLYAAFPPIGLSALVWVALVPLVALVEWPGLPRWERYLSAWAGGLVFWVGSLVWIWELHPTAWLGWWALGLYQSFFWPLWLLAARGVMGRRSGFRWWSRLRWRGSRSTTSRRIC